MIRFFIERQNLKEKAVFFTQEQVKQMRKVLRLNAGDTVVGFDGDGTEYTIEIEKLSHEHSVGKILERTYEEPSAYSTTLIYSLPKNLKLDYIVQKCTELGVDRIIFFSSDFSQVEASESSDFKLARWNKIAIEASEQCGRNYLPQIEASNRDLPELLEYLSTQGDLIKSTYFLHQSGAYLTKEDLEASNELCFFVGPEGGFSKREKEVFAEYKVKTVKIHSNILRSETAGPVLLGQVALLKGL